jgi:hypothetical protein
MNGVCPTIGRAGVVTCDRPAIGIGLRCRPGPHRQRGPLLETLTLFAVADGMGGHAGGEVAASIAVEALEGGFARTPTIDGLVAAVQEANRAVWERGSHDQALRGMGTTVVAAALVATADGDRLVLANVGDSRAYRFHAGAWSSSAWTTRWPRSWWPRGRCRKLKRPSTPNATSSPGPSGSAPRSRSTSGRSFPSRATATCCVPTV